jgi:hypothetical protein
LSIQLSETASGYPIDAGMVVAARAGTQRLKVTKKRAMDALRIIHSRCRTTSRPRIFTNAVAVVPSQRRPTAPNEIFAARFTSKERARGSAVRLATTLAPT